MKKTKLITLLTAAMLLSACTAETSPEVADTSLSETTVSTTEPAIKIEAETTAELNSTTAISPELTAELFEDVSSESVRDYITFVATNEEKVRGSVPEYFDKGDWQPSEILEFNRFEGDTEYLDYFEKIGYFYKGDENCVSVDEFTNKPVSIIDGINYGFNPSEETQKYEIHEDALIIMQDYLKYNYVVSRDDFLQIFDNSTEDLQNNIYQFAEYEGVIYFIYETYAP